MYNAESPVKIRHKTECQRISSMINPEIRVHAMMMDTAIYNCRADPEL